MRQVSCEQSSSDHLMILQLAIHDCSESSGRAITRVVLAEKDEAIRQ